jgi:hypothetical protein
MFDTQINFLMQIFLFNFFFILCLSKNSILLILRLFFLNIVLNQFFFNNLICSSFNFNFYNIFFNIYIH